MLKNETFIFHKIAFYINLEFFSVSTAAEEIEYVIFPW